MAVPQLFSGARGKLLINGKALATVTNVSVSRNDSVRVPHTFGSYAGRSTEPLSTSCSVSIGTVIPANDVNGTAVNSSAIAAGIEPLISLMSASEDVTIEIQDKQTGAVIASVRNCRFTGRSLGLSAQSLASNSWQLVGIYDSAGGGTIDQLGF